MLRGKIILKSERETWTLPRSAFDVEVGRLFELEKSVFGEAVPILRGLDMANRFNDAMPLVHRDAFDAVIDRFFEDNNFMLGRDGSGRRRFDGQNRLDRFDARRGSGR